MQLKTKQATAVATEMKLLTPGSGLVKTMMAAAAKNGRSKINQGSALVIGAGQNFKLLMSST
jgi:hypothetical protein